MNAPWGSCLVHQIGVTQACELSKICAPDTLMHKWNQFTLKMKGLLRAAAATSEMGKIGQFTNWKDDAQVVHPEDNHAILDEMSVRSSTPSEYSFFESVGSEGSDYSNIDEVEYRKMNSLDLARLDSLKSNKAQQDLDSDEELKEDTF